MSNLDVISDHCKKKLTEVPSKILDMTNLKMLFLEGNLITHLPDDFFPKLPQLNWLDLRNNHLKKIPETIAFHQQLECMFLTNNSIERLPNEMGLLPKLRALQVANNPLVYPAKEVISEGTNAIRVFLKEQYEKMINHATDEQDEEILLKVHEVSSNSEDYNNHSATNSISRELNKIGKTKRNPQTKRSSNKMLHLEQLENPSIFVKRLSTNPQKDEPVKIIHKINRSPSKISLKSYFNKVGVKHNIGKINDGVKDAWLNKLRILLTDQERILQQERNLKTLTSWRQEKNLQPIKTYFSAELPKPPYGTYAEYYKIPTREELNQQLDNFIESKREKVSDSTSQSKSAEMDLLINDLVKQLKNLESHYIEKDTPRSEMEATGKQIKAIMDIHKKLINLQSNNDLTL